MAISRYDQPAQSQFLQTYSPMPFNEMVQAGQIMQKQYEDRADTLEKIYDDTYNIKYIPGSKDEQYVKQHVIPTVKNTIEKYEQMDLGDPMIFRQAIRDLNSKIDRQKINKIQESHSGWMTHQQDKRKLALENQLDPDEQDYGVGYDTDTHGVYNKQSSAYVDPILEVQQTYFKPLEDSTISKVSDGLGNMYIKYGVDDKRLKQVVDQNIGNIRGSKLGDRLTRNYIRKYGIDESSLNSRERDNILHKAVLEAGESFKRSNDKVERLNVPNSGGGSGEKPIPSSPISNAPMISLAGTKQDEGPDVDELTGVKKQGWLSKIIDNATSASKTSTTGIPTSLKSIINIFSTGDRNVIKEQDKTPDYKKIEEQAIGFYNYAGKDEKHKTQLVKDYIDQFYTQGRSIPVYELPTNKIAEENENLFIKNNLAANRDWYDPEKPIVPDNKMMYSEVLDEYPQGEYKYSVIGGISNNNPMFPSGRQVGIYKVDDKGNPIKLEKTLYMGADNIEKDANAFPNKFHNINYNVKGQEEYETTIPGTNIRAKISQKKKFLGDPNTKTIYPVYNINISFNKNGDKHTFKGDYNTTEEALSAFSNYFNNTK